jgi:hypothetical protein
MSQTKSKDRSRADQTETKAAPSFEPSEFYEKLSRERHADATRFGLAYSQVTALSLDAYERAKARATSQSVR